MRRLVPILSLFGFLVLVQTSQARAVDCDPATMLGCLDKKCSILGQTMMDREKRHILACLCPSTGTCVERGINKNIIWNSMSSGGGQPQTQTVLCLEVCGGEWPKMVGGWIVDHDTRVVPLVKGALCRGPIMNRQGEGKTVVVCSK
jgi:hypothetical protein